MFILVSIDLPAQRDEAQPRLWQAQVAARECTLAKIDMECTAQWSRWLQRLVRRFGPSRKTLSNEGQKAEILN
jgi:hypothetical protein